MAKRKTPAQPYKDIYREPTTVDPNTAKHLGPLRHLPGTWVGLRGMDINPKAEGAKAEPYEDRVTFELIDPQTNGPQLLRGLRYHQRMVQPGKVETFHDQVGYWLWEEKTETLYHTIALPRALSAMCMGKAKKTDTEFEVVATRGSAVNGISSNPFLDVAFQTTKISIRYVTAPDGTLTYHESTTLLINGKQKFEHTCTSSLKKIKDSPPNPLMAGKKRAKRKAK